MAPSMSGPFSYVPTGHTFYFIKIPLGSAAGHQITCLHTSQHGPSYIPRGQCSEYHAGTQKRWCGCVKLWYCWVWSKSRWSNMIITMGCRLLNQHRPIMQATELTGEGDSTILNQPNPKLTLKIRWKHPVFQMNQICINNYLWRMYKIDISNSN